MSLQERDGTDVKLLSLMYLQYAVAFKIIKENEDHEPKSIDECHRRNDWPKWKDAI